MTELLWKDRYVLAEATVKRLLEVVQDAVDDASSGDFARADRVQKELKGPRTEARLVEEVLACLLRHEDTIRGHLS